MADKKHKLQAGDYATCHSVAAYLCYNKWVEQNAPAHSVEFQHYAVSPRVGELVRVLAIAPHNTSDSNADLLALCRLVKRDALTLVSVNSLQYNKTVTDTIGTRLQNEAIYAASRYIQTFTTCDMDKAVACAKRVLDIFKEYKQC